MGFILKSMLVIAGLFIFCVIMNILRGGGLQVFGDSFYTELGVMTFVIALFLDITFSFQK